MHPAAKTHCPVSNVETLQESVPFAAELFTEAFGGLEEFRYYGGETKERMEWAKENVRGEG